MPEIYKHRQTTSWIWVCYLVILLIAASSLVDEGSLVFALAPLIIIWLFNGLTVEVNQNNIELQFGYGPIKKTIERRLIVGATIIRTKAIWGWGIRFTPQGMLWNVYGLDAVRITYENGKSFIIGSDDVENLLKAILKDC